MAPPGGAAELSVTVPVAVAPGATDGGLKTRDSSLMTVKFVALVAVPKGVVTEIEPVVAVDGTMAVIFVADTTVNVVAATPWNVTAVAPDRLVPVIVTVVPVGPLDGVKELICGSTVK